MYHVHTTSWVRRLRLYTRYLYPHTMAWLISAFNTMLTLNVKEIIAAKGREARERASIIGLVAKKALYPSLFLDCCYVEVLLGIPTYKAKASSPTRCKQREL